MTENNAWQYYFVGREKELQALITAWVQVSDRGKFQLVTLLAESGLGKTRLAQIFYSWLSTKEDEAGDRGYWADQLGCTTNSLTVNPEFPEFAANVPMPWLWWGIRFENPDRRNPALSTGCGVIDALPYLAPHFVPILRQRAASRQLKSVGKQMLGVLANLVTLGTAGNVIYGLNALKELHESNAILKEHQGTESLTAEATRAHDDKIEELLGYFTSLFGETDRTMAKVPAVLLFDDAQWADEDSLRFWRA